MYAFSMKTMSVFDRCSMDDRRKRISVDGGSKLRVDGDRGTENEFPLKNKMWHYSELCKALKSSGKRHTSILKG